MKIVCYIIFFFFATSAFAIVINPPSYNGNSLDTNVNSTTLGNDTSQMQGVQTAPNVVISPGAKAQKLIKKIFKNAKFKKFYKNKTVKTFKIPEVKNEH
jgi:hypothetical protein